MGIVTPNMDKVDGQLILLCASLNVRDAPAVLVQESALVPEAVLALQQNVLQVDVEAEHQCSYEHVHCLARVEVARTQESKDKVVRRIHHHRAPKHVRQVPAAVFLDGCRNEATAMLVRCLFLLLGARLLVRDIAQLMARVSLLRAAKSRELVRTLDIPAPNVKKHRPYVLERFFLLTRQVAVVALLQGLTIVVRLGHHPGYGVNEGRPAQVRAAGVVERARDDIGRKKRAGEQPTSVAPHDQGQGRHHHRRTERMRPHTRSVSYCFCTETHLWQVWIHPP